MRRIIGMSLSMALVFTSLLAVTTTANNDRATDVERTPGCGLGGLGVEGVFGIGVADLNKWKGDTQTLVCRFQGLDVSGWTGDPLPATAEGFGCLIQANSDSPFQAGVNTTDTVLRLNKQGNGHMRCTWTAP